MPYRLRHDLSFCIASDRTVFLDVVGDRYFCLDAAAESQFRDLIGGHDLSSRSIARLKPLLDQGLIVSAELPGISPQAPPSPAESSLLDDWDGDFTLAALPAALIRQTYCSFSYRRRGLRKNLDAIRTLKTKLASRDDADDQTAARGIVEAHLLCGRLLPSRDRCLPRSLALVTALLKAGHRADLVFGVNTSPFAAHCWVQRGRQVLNDSLDHARKYTPILVL